MIAESVRQRIEERHAKLCMICFQDAARRCKKGQRVRSYSLSADANESHRMLMLCYNQDITPEEEIEVKAYHLKYCIREIDKKSPR